MALDLFNSGMVGEAGIRRSPPAIHYFIFDTVLDIILKKHVLSRFTPIAFDFTKSFSKVQVCSLCSFEF
jgi:hypothetical protein